MELRERWTKQAASRTFSMSCEKPPQGFEPWTPALRKLCSTAELRRREFAWNSKRNAREEQQRRGTASDAKERAFPPLHGKALGNSATKAPRHCLASLTSPPCA